LRATVGCRTTYRPFVVVVEDRPLAHPFSPSLEPTEQAALRGRREPGDDFFCLRFQVWYPSVDCAFRTRFSTSPGCADCDQGRFNLRRHAAALPRSPFVVLTAD